MLVIVEGQRNTGKTTAIANFVEITKQNSPLSKFEVISLKLPRENQVVQMIRTFLPMSFDDDKIYVTDRCHISEQVYTELLQRKVAWQQSEMVWAEYFLSLGNTLLIRLKSSIDVLEERERKTKKESEGDIAEISRLFDIHMRRTVLNNVTIDSTFTSPFAIGKAMEDVIYSKINSYKRL